MSPTPRRPLATPARFRVRPAPACAPRDRPDPSAVVRDGSLAAEP